jgi:ABC-type branched-subunit amino acid transport system substrate-binding protein
MNRRLTLSVAAAALCAMAARPAFAQRVVKVGVLEAMTGPMQSVGVQTLAAMRLYATAR